MKISLSYQFNLIFRIFGIVTRNTLTIDVITGETPFSNTGFVCVCVVCVCVEKKKVCVIIISRE